MCIWGTEGGNISKEKLEPLGLVCNGGGSFPNGGMSYHITNTIGDIKIDIYITSKEFDNISNYMCEKQNDFMKTYNKKTFLKYVTKLRRKKLKKLNGNN